MSLIKLTCYCEKWIKKICTKIAILLFTNKAGNGLLSLAQWMGPQTPTTATIAQSETATTISQYCWVSTKSDTWHLFVYLSVCFSLSLSLVFFPFPWNLAHAISSNQWPHLSVRLTGIIL